MSFAVKLTALHDFLAETNACSVASGSVIRKAGALGAASVSAADCLACHGCVSDAEVEVVQRSSAPRLIELLALTRASSPNGRLVVALAPLAEVALCQKFALTAEKLYALLSFKLRRHGVLRVIDMQLASLLREQLLRQCGCGFSLSCPAARLMLQKDNPDLAAQFLEVPSRETLALRLLHLFNRGCLRGTCAEQLPRLTLRACTRSRARLARGTLDDPLQLVCVTECHDKKLELFLQSSPPNAVTRDHSLSLVLTAAEFLEVLDALSFNATVTAFRRVTAGGALFSERFLRSQGIVYGRTPWPIYRFAGSLLRAPALCAAASAPLFEAISPACDDVPAVQLCSGINKLARLATAPRVATAAGLTEVYACPTGCFNGPGLRGVVTASPQALSEACGAVAMLHIAVADADALLERQPSLRAAPLRTRAATRSFSAAAW